MHAAARRGVALQTESSGCALMRVARVSAKTEEEKKGGGKGGLPGAGVKLRPPDRSLTDIDGDKFLDC